MSDIAEFSALQERLSADYVPQDLPEALELRPQSFHTLRRQADDCFNAGFDAANDVFAWAIAPVSAGVKSLENRSHTLRAGKGANKVIAVRVMLRVAKRNNIDPVALVQGNADFPHDSVKSDTAAFT